MGIPPPSEQIKFLLGHSSIQTTERYLGSDQEIAVAVNYNLGLLSWNVKYGVMIWDDPFGTYHCNCFIMNSLLTNPIERRGGRSRSGSLLVHYAEKHVA
jgi:hypothetical protein